MNQEIKEMVENIPAEVRWNIASQASTGAAVALDKVLPQKKSVKRNRFGNGGAR